MSALTSGTHRVTRLEPSDPRYTVSAGMTVSPTERAGTSADLTHGTAATRTALAAKRPTRRALGRVRPHVARCLIRLGRIPTIRDGAARRPCGTTS
jgi:hypothetical protein